MLKRLPKDRVFDLLIIMSDMRSDSPWLLHSLMEASEEYRVKLIFISEDFPSKVSMLAKNRFSFAHVRISNKFQLLLLCLRLLAQLEHRQIKVMHVHGFIAGLVGAFLHIFGVGRLFMYTRHHGLQNYVDGRKLMSWIDRKISLFADQLIVHSQRTYSQLLNKEGIDFRKLTYLPIGIDSEEFKGISNEMVCDFRNKYGIATRDFLIGTNARAVPLKGIEFVLEAFTSLSLEHSNLKLLMINMSDTSHYLQELQKKYHSKDIVFVNKVESIALFFHSLDIFCHVPISEFAEPAGLVLLEALASGVPCIATDCGLIGEFPLPEGWKLVPFRSSSAIAEEVEYVIKLNRSKVYSKRNPRNSLLNFPGKFDVTATTKKQVQFYNRHFRTLDG